MEAKSLTVNIHSSFNIVPPHKCDPFSRMETWKCRILSFQLGELGKPIFTINGKSSILASVPFTMKGWVKFEFSPRPSTNKSTKTRTFANSRLIVRKNWFNWAELFHFKLKYKFVNNRNLLSRDVQPSYDASSNSFLLSECVIKLKTFLCCEQRFNLFSRIKAADGVKTFKL